MIHIGHFHTILDTIPAEGALYENARPFHVHARKSASCHPGLTGHDFSLQLNCRQPRCCSILGADTVSNPHYNGCALGNFHSIIDTLPSSYTFPISDTPPILHTPALSGAHKHTCADARREHRSEWRRCSCPGD